MDYAELIRRVPIQLWHQNRDLVTELPMIVAQAHEQVVQLIDRDFFRVRAGGLTLPMNGVLDLEALVPDIMEVRALRVQPYAGAAYTPLFRRDLEMLSMLYPDGLPGVPQFWAEYDGPLNVRVFPAPDVETGLEITANVEPQPLSEAHPRNILGDRAPRVMETATLVHAARFMKDAESEARYGGEMQAAITELNISLGRRRRDDTGQRPVETTNTMGR